MQCLFYVMEVNNSFSDLFHDFSALLWVEFANEVLKTSIWAVLEDDDQELFFLVKEEFTGFDNVWMLEWDIHLSLIFRIGFLFLGEIGDIYFFKSVLLFVDGFNKVDFTVATFPQRFEENVVIDFLKHSFGQLNLWIKIMWIFYLIRPVPQIKIWKNPLWLFQVKKYIYWVSEY